MVPKPAKSWEAIAMDHKWMIWNVRPTSGVPEWSPSVQKKHGYPRFVRFKLKFARNDFPKFKNMFIMFHNKSYRGMILLKYCQTFVFFQIWGFITSTSRVSRPLSTRFPDTMALGAFAQMLLNETTSWMNETTSWMCQGLNSQYLHI